MRRLTKENYICSQWSGGTTTQLYLAPEGASYGDRDFLWRVSSATVELEESDFTALPDYDRWIATLEGSITLTHGDGQRVCLAPYEVYAFDGGAHTHSRGRCTDFNLMVRKGKGRGALRALRVSGEDGTTIEAALSGADGVLVLYCARGRCRLTEGGESILLEAGDSVLAEAGAVLTARGQAELMVAEVCF